MEITYFHMDIEKFFRSTNMATLAKISRLLFLLAERGHTLGMPHVRNLTGGLYEAQILGEHNVRIFYAFHDETIVLLHAISKKTQKLHARDVDTARGRLARLREI